MKEVRYMNHYPNGMTKVSVIPVKNISRIVVDMTTEAYKVLRESGADHIMFARKVLKENGEIESFRTYQYLQMTDKEFDERIACLDDSIVYAVHKQK